jgi:hypothetical protein
MAPAEAAGSAPSSLNGTGPTPPTSASGPGNFAVPLARPPGLKRGPQPPSFVTGGGGAAKRAPGAAAPKSDKPSATPDVREGAWSRFGFSLGCFAWRERGVSAA